jgi:hypothetical protein
MTSLLENCRGTDQLAQSLEVIDDDGDDDKIIH